VDESGDHNYLNLDKASGRYLGLTGCIIEQEAYRTTIFSALEALKQKHFPYNPDEPVILHRTEIVSRNGPFWRLREPKVRIDFNNDLMQFIQTHEFIVISVVIDKEYHWNNFGTRAFHPYHYCLAALLERYCGWLAYRRTSGDVMAESRNGQDRPLQQAYKDIYDQGTRYRNAEFFNKTLTSREIKLKNKKVNVNGLQLADLLAHPCKEEILIERGLIEDTRGSFTKEFRKSIDAKYNKRGWNNQVAGYGKVFLGKK
jgi:hypothetical protein